MGWVILVRAGCKSEVDRPKSVLSVSTDSCKLYETSSMQLNSANNVPGPAPIALILHKLRDRCRCRCIGHYAELEGTAQEALAVETDASKPADPLAPSFHLLRTVEALIHLKMQNLQLVREERGLLPNDQGVTFR